MLKRLNFTDRRRIPRSQVVIRATGDQHGTFTLDIPADIVADSATQVVYIDVTSAGSSEVLRHRPAVTSAGISRGPFPLGKLDWRRAMFDIKVVEVSEGNPGRIVRRAEGIRAFGAGRNAGDDVTMQLLSTARRPLGQRAWLLECGDPVTIVINDSLSMTDDEFAGHPAFTALVFPEICRQALEWAIVTEGRQPADLTFSDHDAASLWLRFALAESSGEPFPARPPEGWTLSNRGDLDEWIGFVVDRLCNHHSFLTGLAGKSLEAIK
jgi:hypothetical protein